MLDVTAPGVWEFANEALREKRRRLKAIERIREQYQTPWHRGATDLKNFDSRNAPFEYIALTIATVVFENPRWQVTAKRGIASRIDAPALQSGLDRWTKDVRLRQNLAALYVDYAIAMCTTLMQPAPIRQTKGERGKKQPARMRPEITRISTSCSFEDQRVFDREQARFAGHAYVKDREDLIEQAENDPDSDWSAKAIKAIPQGSGVKEVRDDDVQEPGAKDRGEIALMDVHVPEYELPDDDPHWKEVPDDERHLYKGTLFTVPYSGSPSDDEKQNPPDDFPRAPRPFYGPATGPYQNGGAYPVPDDALPLSMLVATEGQNQQNNAMAKALFEAIVEYKRLVFTSHKQPRLANLVKQARHGSVVPADLQDLTRMLTQVEVGGPTPALITATQLMQDAYDRAAGTSDSYRGNVTGIGTATEQAIAARGSTARTAFPKQRFLDFVTDIGYCAAWYMHFDDRVVFDLDAGLGQFFGGNPDAHRETIIAELIDRGYAEPMANAFVDFIEQKWRTVPFESYDLSIVPMSTERASEESNRVKIATVVPLVVQLAAVGAQMPWVKVREILEYVGQAFDLPRLPDIIDQKMMAQAAQMAAAAQVQEASGGQSAPQPRLAGDVQPQAAPGVPGKGKTSRKPGLEPKVGRTANVPR